MTKVLGWLFGVATLLGTGGYVIVHIVRWEWNRAAIAATLFVATEVVLATALLLRAVHRSRSAAARPGPAPAPAPPAAGREDPDVLALVRAAPRPALPFPWLGSLHLERTSVFIPVLLGAGLALSGLAWVVQWVASRTSESGREEELAADLTGIAMPARPLVVPDDVLVAAGHPRPAESLERLVRPGV